MGIVGVSRETKKKLIEAAQSGEGIEPWLFEFICTDNAFQTVLVQAAEKHGNARFLECLKIYKEERLNRLAAARAAKPQQEAVKQITPPRQKNPSTHQKGKRVPPHKRWHQAPRGFASPLVVQKPRVTEPRAAGDIDKLCPKCGARVPIKAMQDHIDLACRFRGQSDNWKKAQVTPWSGPSYDGHWKPF